MGRAVVEGVGYAPAGDAIGHAGGRGVLAARSVSTGRSASRTPRSRSRRRCARRCIQCSSRRVRWRRWIWPPPDSPSGPCAPTSKIVRLSTAVWFSLAALAKETAILAPAALVGWEFVRLVAPVVPVAQRQRERLCGDSRPRLSSRAKLDGTAQLLTPADPSAPAHALVRLPLLAHRIRLRQSGILPLQRCRHAQPAALPAGPDRPPVASLRLHASCGC